MAVQIQKKNRTKEANFFFKKELSYLQNMQITIYNFLISYLQIWLSLMGFNNLKNEIALENKSNYVQKINKSMLFQIQSNEPDIEKC